MWPAINRKTLTLRDGEKHSRSTVCFFGAKSPSRMDTFSLASDYLTKTTHTNCETYICACLEFILNPVNMQHHEQYVRGRQCSTSMFPMCMHTTHSPTSVRSCLYTQDMRICMLNRLHWPFIVGVSCVEKKCPPPMVFTHTCQYACTHVVRIATPQLCYF